MKRILIAGYTESVFDTQLNNALKKCYKDSFEFYSFKHYKQLTKEIELESWETKRFYLDNKKIISILFSLYFFHIPLLKILKLIRIKNVCGCNNPITLYNFFIEQLRYSYYAYYFEHILLISTVHFHTIQKDHTWLTHYFSKKVKIVFSVWGSDLLRVSKPFDYCIMHKALHNASIITTIPGQMKDFLLIKYGNDLKQKIVCNQFIISKEIINAIDKNRNNTVLISDFKKRYNITSEVVLIGHSGHKEEQHIKILNSIEKNQILVEKGFTYIIQASYGLTKDYEERINSFIKHSSLKIIVIKDYLSIDDLSVSKIIGKFGIFVPITGSVAASVIESLYAGSKCIVGGWLPFNRLRLLGFKFIETDTIANVSKALLSANNLSLNIQDIKKIIEKEYFSDEILVRWKEILT